jgi:ABC-2 type transport system ATP-binding protein
MIRRRWRTGTVNDVLQIDGLHRRFGDVQALAGVDLRVHRGEIVGFVGRNGAGKTTTMRAIVGLVEPEAGTCTWDGAPLTAEVRRRIGYMPEERGLYPRMSVAAQLSFLGELSGMTAAEAVASTEDVLARRGIRERAEDTVDELSLGNQQRVQLAAALVCRPELLLLDEPFSGLDPVGVEVLSTILHEGAARGAAVLFSSHQLDLVERLCDRVVLIDAGRVRYDGAVDGRLRERFMEVAHA